MSRSHGCPKALYGHSPSTADGRCSWCGQQVEYASPMPTNFGRYFKSEEVLAYEYYYDPDYGTWAQGDYY